MITFHLGVLIKPSSTVPVVGHVLNPFFPINPRVIGVVNFSEEFTQALQSCRRLAGSELPAEDGLPKIFSVQQIWDAGPQDLGMPRVSGCEFLGLKYSSNPPNPRTRLNAGRGWLHKR